MKLIESSYEAACASTDGSAVNARSAEETAFVSMDGNAVGARSVEGPGQHIYASPCTGAPHLFRGGHSFSRTVVPF